MPPKHLHEEQHRGMVPTDQLGAASGTAGWVLSDDGAGFAEWAAASGGGREPVVGATTVAGDIAGGDFDGPTVTIDAVSMGAGVRFLIKDQADATENGIYVVEASGPPSRAADFDTGADVFGAVVAVVAGTVNAGTLWVCTAYPTAIVDTDDLPFEAVGSVTVPTLAEVLAAGNDTEGQLIVGTDAGSSTGGSLEVKIAIGASGGGSTLKGGDGSGGATGAEVTAGAGAAAGGGELDLFAGNGPAGDPGGAIFLFSGTGDAGSDDGSGIDLNPGDGTGNAGKVGIYTDTSYGTATQILTADGSGGTTWEDAPSGTFTPAADPGDIADPTMATAEDVAVKLNALMAAMRTAGNLV